MVAPMRRHLALAATLVLLAELVSPAVATPSSTAQRLPGISPASAPESPAAAWQCWDPGNADPCHLLYLDGASDVEVLSPGDAWAAGSGFVWRWNGSGWSQVQDAPAVVDLDMFSSTDGWAVSADDIYRWDGLAWISIATYNGYYLQGIEMLSPADGWAIGLDTLMHWDGNTWTEDPGATGLYRGVAAVAVDDAWAVGGDHIYGPPSVIAHWVGGHWTYYPSPVDRPLFSVSMVSSNDGWAVGEWGRLLHWNGSAWNQVASPTSANLYGVAMAAWNDGWAVGNQHILHYDGHAWTDFTSSPPLLGVALASSSEGWAVGSHDFLHWDGQAWTRYERGLSAGLTALSMVSATDGWAVGNEAFVHWDGSTWTPQVPAGLNHPIHSIDMATATEGWVVGSAHMWHWDGSQWTHSACPAADCYLFDVKMLTATLGWAVGSSDYQPVVLHWDGNTWSPMPFGFGTSLYAVDATSETDVWVAGGWTWGYPYPYCGPEFFHWDGTAWTAMSAALGMEARMVDMVSPTDGWAAGDCNGISSSIYHWDGYTWSPIMLPPGPAIGALSMASSTDGWASTGVSLWHWDGAAWMEGASPASPRNVNGIEMLSSTEGWAAGDAGILLRFGPYPDLQLHADGEPDPVQAGETLTFTLDVENDGAGAATGIVLTATLSLSATLHVGSTGCTQQGHIIHCEGGDLAPGAHDTVTFSVAIDPQATGVLFTGFQVAAQEPDPLMNDNAAQTLTFVNGRWDVDLPVVLWRQCPREGLRHGPAQL